MSIEIYKLIKISYFNWTITSWYPRV